MKVIISTPLLLEEGIFTMEKLTLEEAKKWVNTHSPKNYSGHATVKVLGIEPSTDRAVCESYTQALTLKPVGRLEFGKEYSIEEILNIGIIPYLITKG